DLARVVIDRPVFENRVIDTRDHLKVETAGRPLARSVIRVFGSIAGGKGFEVDPVLGIARVGETAIAELVDQKGDPLIAISTMSKAGVAEEPDHGFVQLHPLRRLGAVRGDSAL